MNRATGLTLIGTLALLLTTTGCSTIAKRAFYEARGASGDYLVEQIHAEDYLQNYQAVRFLPATAALGSQLVPLETLRAYDEMARTLHNDELRYEYPGSEPELIVETEFLLSQNKGILDSALCIARTQLKNNGRVITDGVVVVKSKSFRKGDAADLGEEAAETVADYLFEWKYLEDELKERKEARREREKQRED